MPKKILFIDDDLVLQEVLVKLLASHLKDYEVQCASNSEEGIAEARRRKPDVIVLDIVLKEENGWETAEALKNDKTTRSIPIIVASGAGSPFNGLPYIDSKIIAKFIRKPYDVEELIEAIREVTASARPAAG